MKADFTIGFVGLDATIHIEQAEDNLFDRMAGVLDIKFATIDLSSPLILNCFDQTLDKIISTINFGILA